MGSSQEESLWKSCMSPIRGWSKAMCQVYKACVRRLLGNSAPVLVLNLVSQLSITPITSI